jgi:hypothetical protein
MHPPSVPCGFRRLMSHLFGFARIGTFGFSFPDPRNMLTSFSKSAALTYLPLTQDFIWLLDACAPVDLQVLATWLIDMLVLPLGLLLVFPV